MRVPPLPIPNREVKPHHADGTAKVGEQVIATLTEGFRRAIAGSLFYVFGAMSPAYHIPSISAFDGDTPSSNIQPHPPTFDPGEGEICGRKSLRPHLKTTLNHLLFSELHKCGRVVAVFNFPYRYFYILFPKCYI